jgi:hypothetical protein
MQEAQVERRPTNNTQAAPTEEESGAVRTTSQLEHEQVAKVTGMLQEIDQTEVLNLLESPDTFKAKVAEAMEVPGSAQHFQQTNAPPEQQLTKSNGFASDACRLRQMPLTVASWHSLKRKRYSPEKRYIIQQVLEVADMPYLLIGVSISLKRCHYSPIQ